MYTGKCNCSKCVDIRQTQESNRQQYVGCTGCGNKITKNPNDDKLNVLCLTCNIKNERANK